MPTILGYHLLAQRFLPIKRGQAKRQAFLLGAQGEDFLRDPPHPFRRKEASLGAFADYVNALSAAELLTQETAFAHSHPQKKDLIRAYLAGFLCHRAYWEAVGPFSGPLYLPMSKPMSRHGRWSWTRISPPG